MTMTNKVIILLSIALITFYLMSYKPLKNYNQAKIINDIFDYSMITIIKRCQNDHHYTDEDMIILEREFKKFLILSRIAKEKSLKGLSMYSKDVDNLWHTFILFTKEYAEFCKKYIHHFIHHAPEINKDIKLVKTAQSHQDYQAFIKLYEETFKEEIHSIWFLDAYEKINILKSGVS